VIANELSHFRMAFLCAPELIGQRSEQAISVPLHIA
jgi:hypothetical protein